MSCRGECQACEIRKFQELEWIRAQPVRTIGFGMFWISHVCVISMDKRLQWRLSSSAVITRLHLSKRRLQNPRGQNILRHPRQLLAQTLAANWECLFLIPQNHQSRKHLRLFWAVQRFSNVWLLEMWVEDVSYGGLHGLLDLPYGVLLGKQSAPIFILPKSTIQETKDISNRIYVWSQQLQYVSIS